VIAFFVLSGFWISRSITERHAEGRWRWSDYAIDRLTRLWLVLIPALVLGGLLDLMSLELARFPYAALGPTILGGDFARRLTPEAFFGDIFFLQKLLVPMFGSNTALWSLANEFWYYLWFPAIVGIVTRRAALAPSLAAAASLIAFPSLLPGFLCWLAGAALFAASRRWRAPGWTAWPAILLGAGVLVAIRWKTSGADLAVALVVALVLWCAGDADARVLRPLAAFGRQASYSLYVCHVPILTLMAGLLLPGRRLQASEGPLLEVAGACLVVIACGWGVSRLTEAHTGAVRRRVRSAVRRAGAILARRPWLARDPDRMPRPAAAEADRP
jgi:peptidoglycan/LPS O-acetylase OafA/YrhL